MYNWANTGTAWNNPANWTGAVGYPDDATDTTTSGDGDDTGTDDDQSDAPPTTFTGLAATVGNIDPTNRWLVPGLGVVPAASTSVWVMNPDVADAVLTIQHLGPARVEPTQVVVAAGTIAEIPVDQVEVTGTTAFEIDSSVPISVALSVSGEAGVAFIAAISAGEET